jgi:hypothetical protein
MYQVINLSDDSDHGTFDSLDEARGCVQFDRLTAYSIWRGEFDSDGDFIAQVRVENCEPYDGDDERAREATGLPPLAPYDGDDEHCAHEWAYSGTAYGGDDESYHGEGRCYCVYCGADGDA